MSVEGQGSFLKDYKDAIPMNQEARTVLVGVVSNCFRGKVGSKVGKVRLVSELR